MNAVEGDCNNHVLVDIYRSTERWDADIELANRVANWVYSLVEKGVDGGMKICLVWVVAACQ